MDKGTVQEEVARRTQPSPIENLSLVSCNRVFLFSQNESLLLKVIEVGQILLYLVCGRLIHYCSHLLCSTAT